jgi:hypothetical protein
VYNLFCLIDLLFGKLKAEKMVAAKSWLSGSKAFEKEEEKTHDIFVTFHITLVQLWGISENINWNIHISKSTRLNSLYHYLCHTY